jgi:hypothetical protein
MALQTALTKRLGLRYPVTPPRSAVARPDFLAALAREGAMVRRLMHTEPEV